MKLNINLSGAKVKNLAAQGRTFETRSQRDGRMVQFWANTPKLVALGQLLALDAGDGRTLAAVLAAGEALEFESTLVVEGRKLPLAEGFTMALVGPGSAWLCPVCRSAHGSGIQPSKELDAVTLAKNPIYYNPATKSLITFSATCAGRYITGFGMADRIKALGTK